MADMGKIQRNTKTKLKPVDTIYEIGLYFNTDLVLPSLSPASISKCDHIGREKKLQG